MVLTDEEFALLSKDKKKAYIRSLKQIRCKTDLIYLLKDVLGYNLPGPVHKPMIDFANRKAKKKQVLVPRGSLKTTILTIGKTIQRIINNGNIRILLDSEVLGYTEKLLAQIKRDMQKPAFVELFGNMISSEFRETANEFTVTTRTNYSLKEPTLSTGGVGAVKNGPHYDYIVVDDVHSEKNVATGDQIDKVIAHYRLLLSLLEPDGEILMIGTRWHFKDLYSYIIEEEAMRSDSEWNTFIQDAERKGPTITIAGKEVQNEGNVYELFWPERLSKDFLDEQRVSQGPYLYGCLYRNKPVSDENAMFKKEDFRYWEGVDYPLSDGKRIFLNIYILIDRAFSTKDHADYTGCAAVGVSTTGNIYVLEAERHKFGLLELFNLVTAWIKKYGADRIRKVGIETLNFEEVEQFFGERMRKANTFFILEQLRPDHGISKERRVRDALEARVRMHSLYLKKGMIDLEDELMRFPKCTHDDIIDAVAYIVQFMTIPGSADMETEDVSYEPSGWFGKTGY